MLESGEYFYSIAALFSLAAYLLSNMLWLRIFLVLASTIYIISGISLGITSMVGWNSTYLAINLFYVVTLLLDKSTIRLPDETKGIYQRFFTSMSTREFKKIITMNQFVRAANQPLIVEGEITDTLFIILDGKVEIVSSDQTIAVLSSGDLVGEMSFMSNQPASATAIAVGSVQYAYWTHQDLERLNRKGSGTYNKFISIVGRDLVRKLNRKNKESQPNSETIF